ncbi:type II toxin-antitoxin system Phd/YefM family antitoxin [Luteimicrobium subarcticum]|uniref:Antitoxin n=1 Tax=Luteimicrobium subarcticum TaxID=620910 RepID=A0A2M8WT61_9MICO|nr:type II toxin-antitoxin system prevent-host-death family antitoxin [Luteimicrobium subarcticum]PJI94142.1 prevent-host-death family protein [Luteimicrobium subarcticum]
MTTVVNVQDAKTRLSELLHRVERGEDVVIARAGTPVARLAPVDLAWERPLGTVRVEVPDSFFAALPDEELDAWQ